MKFCGQNSASEFDQGYSTVDDVLNLVWAVPEIKTRFTGSHAGSAILKSENLADPASVPF